MAAMGILKHPDVYTASVVRSGVTDWRHYDTIYTERYMSTPQLNEKGYDIGRAMNPEYIENFKNAGGKILIMTGSTCPASSSRSRTSRSGCGPARSRDTRWIAPSSASRGPLCVRSWSGRGRCTMRERRS